MVASPNLCDKSWITDQYDRYVQGNTVLAQPEDAGMVRVDEETNLGVAIATDCNGRFAKLDPFAGAQLALAESYRNVAATGARPLAVTDCLNFGSPEDPDVMWQFAEATRGLAEGCRALGIPVTGGNVSFYNQTGDVAILPTPVVGVLGVIDDVTRRTPIGLRRRGPADLPARHDPRRARRVRVGARRARPPGRDAAAARPGLEGELADILINASRDGLIDAAHDLSDGGLAQALVESCLRHDVGARVWLPDELDPFVALFSESAARAIVAVPRSEEVRFTDMCSARGFAHQRIGVTDGQGPTRYSTCRISSPCPWPTFVRRGAPRCPPRWAASVCRPSSSAWSSVVVADGSPVAGRPAGGALTCRAHCTRRAQRRRRSGDEPTRSLRQRGGEGALQTAHAIGV